MSRKEIKRVYIGSDSEMIQTAKVIFGSFLEDREAFSAFDSDYGDHFVTRFREDLQEAEDIAKSGLVTAELIGLSSDVEVALEKCKNYYQLSRHFIERAFPENRAVWKEFGYDSYDMARRYQSEMIQFMNQFYNSAMKYRDKLIAVNFSQPMISAAGIGIVNAKNAIARYIATSTLAMMKHKTEYRPYQWRETKS